METENNCDYDEVKHTHIHPHSANHPLTQTHNGFQF